LTYFQTRQEQIDEQIELEKQKAYQPGDDVPEGLFQRGYVNWSQKSEKWLGRKKAAVAQFEMEEANKKLGALVKVGRKR